MAHTRHSVLLTPVCPQFRRWLVVVEGRAAVCNHGLITNIRVMAKVEGRFDDRLASTGSRFLSATDLVLTTWDANPTVPAVLSKLELTTRGPGRSCLKMAGWRGVRR